jgi:arginyl-tRNA synthetase
MVDPPARAKFDSEPVFADRARRRVVLLQGGDPDTLRLWQELVDLSKEYLHRMYGRLQVTLTDEDIRGESFYNAMLPDVVAELRAKDLAVESDGALCVFPDGFTGRDDKPLPVIVRKSDGGYNYSTTDLATIRYRVEELEADRAIYVVGSAQALHFRMVFAVARLAGWIPDGVSFEHAQIGNVLGTDGKILRTRAGDTIKLSALLQEGVDRARGILDELEASARIRSIFRRADLDPEQATAPIVVTEAAERALAMKLLGFGAAVTSVAETAEPHRLCAYVFEVASLFTTFYELCPVLKADEEPVRASRLALSALTLRTLVTGLGLLGVPVPERM